MAQMLRWRHAQHGLKWPARSVGVESLSQNGANKFAYLLAPRVVVEKVSEVVDLFKFRLWAMFDNVSKLIPCRGLSPRHLLGDCASTPPPELKFSYLCKLDMLKWNTSPNSTPHGACPLTVAGRQTSNCWSYESSQLCINPFNKGPFLVRISSALPYTSIRSETLH